MTKPTTWCCEAMERYSTLRCDRHTDEHDCPDILVVWSKSHGPGIPIRDGGSSFSTISFCPWCGTNLVDPYDNVVTNDT